MGIIKYLQRLQHIDELIRRRATGRPETFAGKVGLCRSSLMYHLRELREMGGPIGYCKQRESYFYEEEKKLFIGYTDFEIPKAQQRKLTGGSWRNLACVLWAPRPQHC